MNSGSILKVKLPQADGKFRERPVVALKKIEPYNDWLVCGISSNIDIEIEGLDILITKEVFDFKTWGLDFPGLIRTGFLATISSRYIQGSIGYISEGTAKKLLDNLADYLKK